MQWPILPALLLPTLTRIGTSEGAGRLRNAKHLHHQLIRLQLICDSLSFVKHLTRLTDFAFHYCTHAWRLLPRAEHSCDRVSCVVSKQHPTCSRATVWTQLEHAPAAAQTACDRLYSSTWDYTIDVKMSGMIRSVKNVTKGYSSVQVKVRNGMHWPQSPTLHTSM